MKLERATKRMTLRETLTHAEKCARDLVEHLESNVQKDAADLRDLTRPVRRRSHYPTLLAVQNALNTAELSHEESMVLADYLHEQLTSIRDSARKEAMNRL